MTTIDIFTKSLLIVLMSDFLILQDDLKIKYNFSLYNNIKQLMEKILNSVDTIYHKQILNIFYSALKSRCSSDIFDYIIDENLKLKLFVAIECKRPIVQLKVCNRLAKISTHVKNLTIADLRSDNYPNIYNINYINNVIDIIKNNKIKSFEYYQKFSHGQMFYHNYADFIYKIGVNEDIEQIFLTDCGTVDIHLILLNLPNLKKLTIHDQIMRNDGKPRHIDFIYDSILFCQINGTNPCLQFKSLKHLNISNMCDRLPYDILLDLIKRCINLESFHARYCNTLTDDIINILFQNNNITSLEISYCKNISYDTFLKIPIKWPNLTTFNFVGNNIIDNNYLILIASKLNKLINSDLSVWYTSVMDKNLTIDYVASFVHFFGFNSRSVWIDNYIKKDLSKNKYAEFLSKTETKLNI